MSAKKTTTVKILVIDNNNQMNLTHKLILFAFLLLAIACSKNDDKTNEEILKSQNEFTGEYFGQEPPDDTAKIFAPGFISSSLYTRDIAFMPDGKEACFCVSALGFNLIFETLQNETGIWSVPKPASFIEDYSYMYYEPCISHDGLKMYFLSNMPDADSIMDDQDIWCVDRKDNSWGKPYNLGEPINTPGAEFFPSLTINNTLYFTKQPERDVNHYIYRSKFVNGKFEEPEILPKEVNIGNARFNAFISPGEDYIIVPATGMQDTYGGVDYYIVFRNENDVWSKPVNMGNQINSDARGEYSVSLSYDKKYLFFMSDRGISDSETKDMTLNNLIEKSKNILNGNSNIWWISSDIINPLKKNSKQDKERFSKNL